MSDADLKAALAEAGVSPDVAAEAIEANDQARVDGLRSALSVLALIALSGLFLARAIPKRRNQLQRAEDRLESEASRLSAGCYGSPIANMSACHPKPLPASPDEATCRKPVPSKPRGPAAE
jgi:hypothetical protein